MFDTTENALHGSVMDYVTLNFNLLYYIALNYIALHCTDCTEGLVGEKAAIALGNRGESC